MVLILMSFLKRDSPSNIFGFHYLVVFVVIIII